MSGQRITAAAAERIGRQLSHRDVAIVGSLQQTRVLSGQQLTRLHFTDLSPLTQDRTRRAVMERLTVLKVVVRLERAIGGVRAGSTGWIYALGPVGKRLTFDPSTNSTSRIRAVWMPSTLFLQHSLAIAEIYVQLVETTHTGSFRLTTFQTEPQCWWPDGLGGWLKPDAFVVPSGSRYDELIWLEVDRGTESLPTLKRKLANYQSFVFRGQLGPSGVLPQVVISTTSQRRADDIKVVIEHLPSGNELFRVTTDDQVSKLLIELTELAQEERP